MSFIAEKSAIDCMPIKVMPVKVKKSDSLERGLSLWGEKVDVLKDSLPMRRKRVDTFEKCLSMRKKELDSLEELSLHCIFFKYLSIYIQSAALMLCEVSKRLKKYLLYSFST